MNISIAFSGVDINFWSGYFKLDSSKQSFCTCCTILAEWWS